MSQSSASCARQSKYLRKKTLSLLYFFWGSPISMKCLGCFKLYSFWNWFNFSYLCSADDFSGQYMRSLALVSHIGRVFWPPPTKFRSTCPVDVAFFPFDDQTCILKLGSWLHDGYSVSPHLLNNNLSEWIIYEIWAVHHNSISSQKPIKAWVWGEKIWKSFFYYGAIFQSM